MKQTDIFAELQAVGLTLTLLGDQLIIKHDFNPGHEQTKKMLALLTNKREEIKAILLGCAQEMEQNLPYIDEEYNRGGGKKGCLVIPADCPTRYRHWIAPFTCLFVESDDWYEKGTAMKEKSKWKPLSISQTIQELGSSKELIELYCKRNHS